MSKPIHPIDKMQREIFAVRCDPLKVRRLIARHVKPLLDLIDYHNDGTEHFVGCSPTCRACRLVAAWRAKL